MTMADIESDLRELICEIGRRMYAKNLVAATDGNITVKLSPHRFLCTPSGTSKGFMTPDDLLIVDLMGNVISGRGKVTSEFFTHAAVYEERPNAGAVVHAHPPAAVAFTLAGISLMDNVLPEVVMMLDGVPTTPYATPGSREGGKVIRPFIRHHDAVLLDRHGIVATGKGLIDAYHKLEKVEHAAQTILHAHMLGHVRLLEPEDVDKLKASGAAYIRTNNTV